MCEYKSHRTAIWARGAKFRYLTEVSERTKSGVTPHFPIIQRGVMADTREKALQDYRKKLLEHKEVDGRLKECKGTFNTDICVRARNSCCLVDWLLVDGQAALTSIPAS